MDYLDPDMFFKKYLRTKQHHNKKVIGVKDAVWQPLLEDTSAFGKNFPKGSMFKCFETRDFGWVVFHPDTVDTFGYKLNQRIFKY